MALDITFGGVTLSSVAPSARVLTFNVSGISAEIATVKPVARRGDLLARLRLPPRSIDIEIILNDHDPDDRLAALQAISAWAYSETAKTLSATHMAGWHFDAICEEFPAFVGNDPTAKVKLSFLALAPEYIKDTANTGASGTTLTIGGKLATWVNLTATLAAPVSSLAWTLDGKTITLTGDIPAGTVAVDSERGKVTHTDGLGAVTSLNGMLSYDSKFWFVAPGSRFASGPTATFSWRERKL